VARVALLSPDLLFGSKVDGGLRAAGHEVTVFGAAEQALAADADLVIVDLASGDYDAETLARLGAGVTTLGFYSHVDQDTRQRAEEAGFDLVVPRSRMAREMADLVDRLVPA
jgi:DNA-binding response OmpR family regulator